MPFDIPDKLGTAKDLIKRFEKVKAQRLVFERLLKDAYHFVAPNRQLFDVVAEGSQRNRHIFDDTATSAANRYVARRQATLMPSWREWSILKIGKAAERDLTDREQQAVNEDLEQLNKDLFRFLNHSNFYQVLPEALLDLCISTGALKIDRGDVVNPFKISAAPLACLWFEEGPNGLIENVWRKPKIPGRMIERLWPNADLTDQTKRKIEKDGTLEIDIVEATLFEPESEEYWAVLIELADTSDSGHIAWSQNEGESSPWVVFREDKVPGEVYGRGPGIKALPTIKTVNKMVEFTLRWAGLSVGGIYTAVTDGVVNPFTLQIVPNSIIPVQSNNAQNPSLQALDIGGQPDFSQIVLADQREAIRKMFNADTRRGEGPVKSATEIAIDDRDLLMEEGHAAGRLQTELVERTVRRLLHIMTELGLAPVIRLDGQETTIKHTSPLSRAQDVDELLALSRAFEAGNGMVGPEIMATQVRIEDVPEAIFKRTGAPESLLREETEAEQVSQAIGQFVASQQQTEAA